jgi:putative flippase GtrA
MHDFALSPIICEATLRGFAPFMAGALIGLTVNIGVTCMGAFIVGLPPLAAKLMGVAIAFIANFLINLRFPHEAIVHAGKASQAISRLHVIRQQNRSGSLLMQFWMSSAMIAGRISAMQLIAVRASGSVGLFPIVRNGFPSI